MFCPKCGKARTENANMCPNCGYLFMNSSNPESHSSSLEERSISKKIASVLSAIGTVIALIFCIYACTADKNELANDIVDIAEKFLPVYSTAIKNDTPAGYNTSVTYGQAFERYFDKCKWNDETKNSKPIVRFTGIFDNEDGTYSKVEVIFDITDMDGGDFYYNIDTVVVDGLDLGAVGVYGLMEDIFNTVTLY